jgi:hypothetical protein
MNFKLSKPRKFKNIEGSYAFVNPPLKVEFESETIFDTNVDSVKPIVMIKTNKKINEYITQLKENLETKVKDLSFVSPIKTIKRGKKLIEAVKMKLTDPEITNLPKKTKVQIEVTISSIWTDNYAFGVYLNITKVNVLNENKKCLMLDTDTESEINVCID